MPWICMENKGLLSYVLNPQASLLIHLIVTSLHFNIENTDKPASLSVQCSTVCKLTLIMYYAFI